MYVYMYIYIYINIHCYSLLVNVSIAISDLSTQRHGNHDIMTLSLQVTASFGPLAIDTMAGITLSFTTARNGFLALKTLITTCIPFIVINRAKAGCSFPQNSQGRD